MKNFMKTVVLILAVFVASPASALVDCLSTIERENNVELSAYDHEAGENDSIINWSMVAPQNYSLYIEYLTCEENNGRQGVDANSVEVTMDGLVSGMKPLTYSGLHFRAFLKHGKLDILKTVYAIRAVFEWVATSAEAQVYFHGGENELDEMLNTLMVPVSVIGMMADSEQPAVVPPLAYAMLNCDVKDKTHCIKPIKEDISPMYIPMLIKGVLTDILFYGEDAEDMHFEYYAHYGDESLRDIKKYLKRNSKFHRLVNKHMPDTRGLPDDALVGTPVVFDYKGVTGTIIVHKSAPQSLVWRLTHKAKHANKYQLQELVYLMRNATYWKDLLVGEDGYSQYKDNKIVYTTVMSFKNIIKSISKYVNLDEDTKVPVLMDFEGTAYKALAAIAGDIVGGDYKVAMYKGIVNNVNFVYEEGKLKKLPNFEYMEVPEDFPELTVPVSNRELKHMKKWSTKQWEEFKNEA